MPEKKLTSFEIHHLKGLAKQLPILLDNTHEKHLVSGKDILEWGTVTEIDGKPIDPEKKYNWHYPVQMYRNHYRRLKRAYQKRRMDGMWDYLKEVDQFLRDSQQGDALVAFANLQQFLTR